MFGWDFTSSSPSSLFPLLPIPSPSHSPPSPTSTKWNQLFPSPSTSSLPCPPSLCSLSQCRHLGILKSQRKKTEAASVGASIRRQLKICLTG